MLGSIHRVGLPINLVGYKRTKGTDEREIYRKICSWE